MSAGLKLHSCLSCRRGVAANEPGHLTSLVCCYVGAASRLSGRGLARLSRAGLDWRFGGGHSRHRFASASRSLALYAAKQNGKNCYRMPLTGTGSGLVCACCKRNISGWPLKSLHPAPIISTQRRRVLMRYLAPTPSLPMCEPASFQSVEPIVRS